MIGWEKTKRKNFCSNQDSFFRDEAGALLTCKLIAVSKPTSHASSGFDE